jgi:hypothetical protein
MNFKAKYSLPLHMQEANGLPRSQTERLMWIKRRVEEGYYDTEKVIIAVANAFLEQPDNRRAGDQAFQKQINRA